MNELTCKKCNETTIMCDEGVVAVTCSMCVMIDVEVCNGQFRTIKARGYIRYDIPAWYTNR